MVVTNLPRHYAADRGTPGARNLLHRCCQVCAKFVGAAWPQAGKPGARNSASWNRSPLNNSHAVVACGCLKSVVMCTIISCNVCSLLVLFPIGLISALAPQNSKNRQGVHVPWRCRCPCILTLQMPWSNSTAVILSLGWYACRMTLETYACTLQ